MDTTTAPLALSGRELSKRYGSVRALAGVSLDIPPGQAVAIMGPSGSGKSTLLHCLAGILPPDSGEVALGDTVISALSDARRSRLRRDRLGFVFQDGQLLPELPANENVALPLLLAGTSRVRALESAERWLERLGLSGLGDRRPGEMSGGQAQRVAIARAMVHSPAVVFADEPTGALDQATGHEVMQILTTTAAMTGTTLVLVTHDRKVAGWCSRLVELRDAMIHSDRVHEGEEAR
ncbi:ABC transporter ATP-binding protein [Dietzia sp. PP-33]|jgi:putative ABC transport system ATP-binding protein|uniref:ABC transporter ATP-binding protein n=1 Tax=Dietzia sp. PP-33 TaxID=2957500 RepID=UPI0029B6F49B|nr:ABC transporter ATP-binding protein [Dietzia sp. PP-33]MDX2356578.1 ABC transporter ATP-binding protein [Dietzia sp. PP-33]